MRVLFTKDATTSQSIASYEVKDGVLTRTSAGQRIDLRRLEGGSEELPVYGSWALPTVPINGDPDFMERTGLKIDTSVRIEKGRISVSSKCSCKWATIHASASSPAKITDSTISTLESHEDSREWTASGGERVVYTRSLLPTQERQNEPAPSTVVLGAEFPPLPPPTDD